MTNPGLKPPARQAVLYTIEKGGILLCRLSFIRQILFYLLYDSAGFHDLRNFHESRNVRAVYQIAGRAVFFGGRFCIFMDIYHYLVKFCVNFFKCP
jgi:hypothetical protein